MFDPAAAAALLETVHKGTIDTQWHTVPEGEYIIQCKDLALRQVIFTKIEGTGVGLDITWEVIDEQVKQTMNIDKPTVRQSMLLDLQDGRNALDFGTNRNQQLKNVIEACGLNTGKFSLNTLRNQTCFGRIKHRPDRDDPEVVYAEVNRVTSLEKARTRQQRQADAA